MSSLRVIHLESHERLRRARVTTEIDRPRSRDMLGNDHRQIAVGKVVRVREFGPRVRGGTARILVAVGEVDPRLFSQFLPFSLV